MADAAEIVVERDAVYAEVGRPLRWNVFRPAAAVAGAPGILVYHGGGWRVGDRANMTAACEAFARRGWVAIAPEYRLLGEAPWPAPLDDTRAAIRAAREQAARLGSPPTASSGRLFGGGAPGVAGGERE